MNLEREHKNLIIELAKAELATTNQIIWKITSDQDTKPEVLTAAVLHKNRLVRIISECNN